MNINDFEFIEEQGFDPATLGGLSIVIESEESKIVAFGFLEEGDGTHFYFYPDKNDDFYEKDFELEEDDPELFKQCLAIVNKIEEEHSIKESAEKYYKQYTANEDSNSRWMKILESNASTEPVSQEVRDEVLKLFGLK